MDLRWIEPGVLRLPTTRMDVDLIKLAEQYGRYGGSIIGMPPIEATEGAGGELMINDGVTRATRAHRYAVPGAKVPVVVIDHRPRLSFKHLPKVSWR